MVLRLRNLVGESTGDRIPECFSNQLHTYKALWTGLFSSGKIGAPIVYYQWRFWINGSIWSQRMLKLTAWLTFMVISIRFLNSKNSTKNTPEILQSPWNDIPGLNNSLYTLHFRCLIRTLAHSTTCVIHKRQNPRSVDHTTRHQSVTMHVRRFLPIVDLKLKCAAVNNFLLWSKRLQMFIAYGSHRNVNSNIGCDGPSFTDHST